MVVWGRERASFKGVLLEKFWEGRCASIGNLYKTGSQATPLPEADIYISFLHFWCSKYKICRLWLPISVYLMVGVTVWGLLFAHDEWG